MALSFSLKLMLMESTHLSASKEVERRNPDVGECHRAEKKVDSKKERNLLSADTLLHHLYDHDGKKSLPG